MKPESQKEKSSVKIEIINSPDDVVKTAETMARDIKNWIPVLGEGIAFRYPNNKESKKTESERKYPTRTEAVNEIITEMVKKKEDELESLKDLFDAIQDNNVREKENILFGDIWDGAEFLEDYREEQKQRRKDFAEKLIKTENINIELARYPDKAVSKQTDQKADREPICTNVDLMRLLEVFKGIILTTCQDETVEAFMEYDRAMLVNDDVCEPYSMTTSPKWKQRLDMLLGKQYSQGNISHTDDKDPVLVKLYGTCRKPYRMLLSNMDFETYYPNSYEEAEKSDQSALYPYRFLEELFKNRNLIFIGVDTDTDHNPKLSEGIKKLLIHTQGHDGDAQKRFLLKSLKVEDMNYFIARLSAAVSEVDKENVNSNEDAGNKNDEKPNNPNNSVDLWDP